MNRTASAGSAPQNVLITGADGGIARGLATALAVDGIQVWRTTRRSGDVAPRCLFLDLSDPIDDWQFPPVPIDVAFLCAAVTSLAQCETDSEASARVNVRNTVQLGRRLAANGAFVVFISSNLVLDGDTPFAGVEHPRNPQTAYGRQKAEAERELLDIGQRIAVVRLGKVIVPGMPLFENWTSDLQAGKRIHPFHDLHMAPISLAFAVEVLRRIAAQRRPGIVHATATHDISYAQAAALIAGKLGVNPAQVIPVSHRGSVSAPRHAALDTSGLAALELSAPQPEQAFDHSPTTIISTETQ